MASFDDGTVVIAFDLYGTILDEQSIAEKLAEYIGQDQAKAVAGLWRRYQTESTWRLNSMKKYLPLSTVTIRALKRALADSSTSLEQTAIDSLMEAYDSLHTFPDVGSALDRLSSNSKYNAVVFSNGTQTMVSNSVYHSPDLKPHSSVFKQIIVVGECEKFKPATEVYELLAKKVGKEHNMSQVWLVSGNPFDIVGARNMGMQAAWVDRAGKGWTDELIEGDAGKPTLIASDLGDLIDAIQKRTAGPLVQEGG
ncbi:MAG: hypothetical protein M1835_001180 [Candelina submexicana]|nr:MAG: hypothetical protein M1835_001180 [Candelina submexicana]